MKTKYGCTSNKQTKNTSIFLTTNIEMNFIINKIENQSKAREENIFEYSPERNTYIHTYKIVLSKS